MNTSPDFYERVREKIDKMDSEEFIQLWNLFCDMNDYSSDKVYKNDPDVINCLFKDPFEFSESFSSYSYSSEQDYITMSGLCFSDLFEGPFDISRIMDWLKTVSPEWVADKLDIPINLAYARCDCCGNEWKHDGILFTNSKNRTVFICKECNDKIKAMNK